jgi:hypothetical protein
MSDMTPEKAQSLLDGATPGPWCVADETIIWTQINDPLETTYDIGYPVAETRTIRLSIGHKRWPEGQPEANARLIAAAPDLARTVIAQAAEITRLQARLAAAEKLAASLEGFTDEALLLALIRRNPPSKAPRSRTPHDQDSVIGIGKDHHCYITFQDEDLAALSAFQEGGK